MANLVYAKKPIDVPQQVALLISRGIYVEDNTFAQHVLETVSYYRFSAYLYPFRKNDGTNNFVSGSSFNRCWRYYRFDRKLRFCVIDAIERVEVAVKAKLVNHFSQKYGIFAYRDPCNFASPPDTMRLQRLLDFIDTETQRSKEEFVEHFRNTYDTSNGLPLWMATEVMTFGNMLTFFCLLKKQDKQVIAKSFGSNEHVFESWLLNLNYIRNICAHHGRLWNRQFSISPITPAKDLRWHEKAYPVNNKRIYATLCI